MHRLLVGRTRIRQPTHRDYIIHLTLSVPYIQKHTDLHPQQHGDRQTFMTQTDIQYTYAK